VRKVSTLWIGAELPWIERLCLSTFRDHGYDVTVFSYHPVKGVPHGISVGDAREIFDPDPRILEQTAPSYVADAFRIHLLHKAGHTWIDADILCLRPLDEDPFFFGYTPWNAEVNNCIIGLPKHSMTLRRMVHFTTEPYPISKFVKAQHHEILVNIDDPVERFIKQSQLLRTSIGPKLFSGVLKRSGEIVHAKPAEVLSPVPWQYLSVMFNPYGGTDGWITPKTQTVHLWGHMLRQHRKMPLHKDSFIGKIAQQDYADLDIPFQADA
jgi:hypothetical protein